MTKKLGRLAAMLNFPSLLVYSGRGRALERFSYLEKSKLMVNHSNVSKILCVCVGGRGGGGTRVLPPWQFLAEVVTRWPVLKL